MAEVHGRAATPRKVTAAVPDVLRDVRFSEGGFANLDLVSGELAGGRVGISRLGWMTLSGWAFLPPELLGAVPFLVFLVLRALDGPRVYFAPVFHRLERPDVAAAHRPHGGGFSGPPGFCELLSFADVEPGGYSLSVVHARAGQAFECVCSTALFVDGEEEAGPAGAAQARGRAVIVLGVHRSGTSALAGLLARLGVDAGPHLLRSDRNNPTGYWEHSGIVRLHDELLEALGSGWDDIRPLPAGWELGWEATAAGQGLKALIRRDFDTSDWWLVKDPRMCRLMPIWLELLADLDANPSFVIAARHPAEVAASLQRRDGIPEARGTHLWLQHMIAAEHWTRGYPRLVVPYDQLLKDQGSVVARISATLGLPLPLTDRTGSTIDDFVSSDLKHHHAANAAPTEPNPLIDLARSVYDDLCQVPNSEALALAIDRRRRLAEPRTDLAACFDRSSGQGSPLRLDSPR